MKNIQRDIRRVDNDLEAAQEDLAHLEVDLIADGIDSHERLRLLAQTKEVAHLIDDLEHKRDGLIYELGIREERLERYLSSHTD